MNSRRIAGAAFVAAIAGLVVPLLISVAPASAAAGPTPRGVISTQTRLQIAWPAVTGAAAYQVRYGTRSDFSGSKRVTGIKATKYVLPNLRPGTRYFFKVGTLNASGAPTSQWSATASYRTKSPLKISVGTFNVKDPDSDALGPWATRANLSAKGIVTQGVGLIGLQELYSDADDYLTRINAQAYRAGKGRPYRMTPGDDSGNDNQIVFNSRIYVLHRSGAVEYRTQYCPGGDCESPRAFVWAILTHRASGQKVVFTSTHLTPRDISSIETAQWKQLLGWLKAVRKANPSYKFVAVGDFNVNRTEGSTTTDSTMLPLMRANGFEDVLGQIPNSNSTYRNPTTRVESWICSSNKKQRDVRRTGCSTSPGVNAQSIDYIFVSKALKVPYFRVYTGPRSGYVVKYLTSDHFMLRATLAQ